MDSVTAVTRQEVLRLKLDEAQAALHQAASTANLKDDPLGDHLNALALCVGALGDIYQASEATQIDIAETLKCQTDVISQEAIAKVHASGMALVKDLGPQLASATERTMRQKFQTLRARTIIYLSIALVAAILVPCAFTYAVGLNTGRTQGEVAAHMMQTAMIPGSADGAAWAMLMQYNDGAKALATCRKGISTDADGRHYCFMPVWLDPPQGLPTQQ